MKRATNNYFNTDTNAGGLTILGLIALIVMIVFIAPWLSFWLAYFGGWIAKITIGDYIVRALELIGILITKDQIPLLAGGLGWIGGFFKSISSSKKGN